MASPNLPSAKPSRIILHFDYDCFYASVFEASNPTLRSLPFAVQQKQIIVTCNYEARRRGLHKLMLVKDAKRRCPNVIIELGEDISRFRDASKALYQFLADFSWGGRVERLGFDEVWMDVTDLVEWNVGFLNMGSLGQSFFQMSKEDPMVGFEFDASTWAGHTYPKVGTDEMKGNGEVPDDLGLRLRLGSHLALYVRHQLESQKGYTSTVGVATNKLLSKLVGNLNKPKGQTTLIPPLSQSDGQTNNISAFMDEHEIGKVPGVGFKLAQKLREFVLQRPSDFSPYEGGTKELVTVGDVRKHPDINPEKLETLLSGPGSPHGIGYKVWCLLHGIDDTEVTEARAIPRQISIEDSYTRLETFPELMKQLQLLAHSLITRMRIDLLTDGDDLQDNHDNELENNPASSKKWLAHPKTLRLTTRPRLPLLPDGTRPRSMKRISHSCPLPNFVFTCTESIDSIAEKLVRGTLVHMFRRLHPEKSGWNLSLINLAVTNMAEAGGESKTAMGRDIGRMLRRQEDVLKEFRVTDVGQEVNGNGEDGVHPGLAEETVVGQDEIGEGEWDDEAGDEGLMEFCGLCDSQIPAFAMVAHQRFHSPEG